MVFKGGVAWSSCFAKRGDRRERGEVNMVEAGWLRPLTAFFGCGCGSRTPGLDVLGGAKGSAERERTHERARLRHQISNRELPPNNNY